MLVFLEGPETLHTSLMCVLFLWCTYTLYIHAVGLGLASALDALSPGISAYALGHPFPSLVCTVL